MDIYQLFSKALNTRMRDELTLWRDFGEGQQTRTCFHVMWNANEAFTARIHTDIPAILVELPRGSEASCVNTGQQYRGDKAFFEARRPTDLYPTLRVRERLYESSTYMMQEVQNLYERMLEVFKAEASRYSYYALVVPGIMVCVGTDGWTHIIPEGFVVRGMITYPSDDNG